MIVTRRARTEAAPREPTNTALYAPLAGLCLLALALWLLSFPTAGALVALLGGLYAVAWFAVASRAPAPAPVAVEQD